MEGDTISGGESMEVLLAEVTGVFRYSMLTCLSQPILASQVAFTFPSGQAARAHHVVDPNLRLVPTNWQGPEWR